MTQENTEPLLAACPIDARQAADAAAVVSSTKRGRSHLSQSSRQQSHGSLSPGCAQSRRAQARSVGLGNVRLRQFGLHHRRPDGRVRGLFRRRSGRRGGLGHVRLDRSVGGIERDRDADHAGSRRLCRLACGKKAAVGVVHVRLRADHRRAGRRRAWRRGVGGGCGRAVECVLHLRRIADRGLPARTGAPGQHGTDIGLGLELRLLRRHAHSRAQPRLRDAGPGTRAVGVAVRAGDDADHGRHLRRGSSGDLRVVA